MWEERKQRTTDYVKNEKNEPDSRKFQEIRQDDKKIGKSLPGKELIIKFLSRNNQIFSLL